MRLAFCIIARNEAARIGALIASLAQQTIIADGHTIQVVVVSNDCSDNTAAVAKTALQQAFACRGIDTLVHETPHGGKARSWNLAVHDLLDPDADVALFMDADIEFIEDNVLSAMLDELGANESVLAVSGYPLKDIAKKSHKSLVDLFSLKISSQTPAPHSINGSLYAARMAELKKIYLPVPTPGEDGLLSAMLHSEGFSQPVELQRIKRMAHPTHYFEAHSIGGFFRHEQRMTVGTTINGWIFEALWAGTYSQHVGQLIHEWNRNDPDWVDRLVADKVGNRRWALPPRMLFWRLNNLREGDLLGRLARLPFSLTATLLNIWPCIAANRILRQRGSASYW